MAAEVKETIRKMIYNALHIVGAPHESDIDRIDGEILDGILYLQKHANPDLTFEEGTDGADLLKSYVMYAEDGAADQFKTNYAADVRSKMQEYETDAYAKAMGMTT